IARLGNEDFLVLPRSVADAQALAALKQDWVTETRRPKGFDAWRDEVWAWFHVGGERVSALLAKTCPVDLAGDRFRVLSVAQTRVAHTDCIVVRSDRFGAPGFDLFFDIASSAFVLASLRELGFRQPVGMTS